MCKQGTGGSVDGVTTDTRPRHPSFLIKVRSSEEPTNPNSPKELKNLDEKNVKIFISVVSNRVSRQFS